MPARTGLGASRPSRFDVIAITDHILMKKDLLARAGRIATLGRRAFGVREQDFADYLADIDAEGRRALKQQRRHRHHAVSQRTSRQCNSRVNSFAVCDLDVSDRI